MGSLGHALTSFLVKKFFLMFKLNFPWHSLRPFPLDLLLVKWEKRLTPILPSFRNPSSHFPCLAFFFAYQSFLFPQICLMLQSRKKKTLKKKKNGAESFFCNNKSVNIWRIGKVEFLIFLAFYCTWDLLHKVIK